MQHLADPPHPNCPSQAQARIALALHGSVSGLRLRASALLASSRSVRLADFANVSRTNHDLLTYLMEPSGGASLFDTFIHSTVPSREVQSRMLSLYEPIAARFDGSFARIWGAAEALQQVTARASEQGRLGAGADLASRWRSAALVLGMVAEAERAMGRAYSKVVLTRPDISLWRRIDLRRYCTDRVYVTHCFAPYFSPPCQADFHFVMTSTQARHFAKGASSLLPMRLARLPHNASKEKNDVLREYVREFVGVALVADHVVVGRHVEVLRKLHGSVAARAKLSAARTAANDAHAAPGDLR